MQNLLVVCVLARSCNSFQRRRGVCEILYGKSQCTLNDVADGARSLDNGSYFVPIRTQNVISKRRRELLPLGFDFAS